MKYRMVALDLDGTLLNSEHTLSECTKAYLRYLDKQGITIIIATGRAICTVYDTILDLKLPQAIPVVCSNGAEGLLCSLSADGTSIDSERLFYTPVPEVVAKRTLSLSKELGFVTQYYVGDNVYADPQTSEHFELTNLYKELTGSQTKFVSDDFQKAQELGLPSKQLVLCPDAEQDRLIDVFTKEFSSEHYRIGSQQPTIVRGHLGWFMEVLHPDVNKGDGLKNMCSHLNIPLAECIAFGDGDNDLEFLQMAGKGIAMKNARDVIKAIADEVIDLSNDEDGVVETLRRVEKEGKLLFTGHSKDKQ